MSNLPKVAVITYHRNDNYGAMLQCYALQETLKKQGVEPVVIDYRCQVVEHPLSLGALRVRGMKACVISFIGALTRIPRRSKFKKFRSQLTMTEPVDEETIKTLGNCYDCYFAGSDNVWNADITGVDSNYFLSFVKDPSKKKSYAASFGGDKIPYEQKGRYQLLLGDIDTFLMREKVGAELVTALTGKVAYDVLDPTLLLTREEWETVASPPLIRGKYVLAYQLVPSQNFIKKARSISRKMGCKLVFVPFPLGMAGRCTWRLKDGPQEWLSLFKYAEYVLTDSFHGCVFCILFHKQFSVMVSQLGARIENLMELIGAKNRIINEKTELPQPYMDFLPVDKIIKSKKAESIKMLKQALNMDKSTK